jgi:hypothetical protein
MESETTTVTANATDAPYRTVLRTAPPRVIFYSRVLKKNYGYGKTIDVMR